MERWTGKVAVVTGASAGIGAAVAENLVKNGMQVVGMARRVERLSELSKKMEGERGKFHAYAVDITNEEELIKAFQWIADNLGPIHILINNAGVSRYTSLMAGTTEDWKAILDTNVLALSIASREALKQMKANKIGGHIVHINSVLGHVVWHIPAYNHMYVASKHAVTALAEALRIELAAEKLKIKVTSVSPGYVDTEIAAVGNFPESENPFLMPVPMLSPKELADAIESILATPPNVQVHECTITAI